jgi:hypothetical protein
MDEKTNAAASNEEALRNRVAELEAQLAEKNAIPGVEKALVEDVQRRVALGLPLQHAIIAARSQAENDARIAAEEKAAAKTKKG